MDKDSQDMRLLPTTTISELVALANHRDSPISIDIGDWFLRLEHRDALQEVRQTSCIYLHYVMCFCMGALAVLVVEALCHVF